MTTGAQLPHDLETERALLGSVLINPALMKTLDVSGDAFYHEFHRTIWECFETLQNGGKAIDYISVSEQLKKRGASKEDLAYMGGLITRTVSSMHAETYAGIVKEKARRRQLTMIANDMVKTAFDDTKDLEHELPGILEQIVNTSAIREGARPISEVMSALYDQVEERSKNPQEIWGMSTGLPKLDKLTGGLQKGEVWLLMGRPGVGKSIFGMQLAANLGTQGPGAIYSLEMKGLSVARRLVSGKSSLTTRDLKTGMMKDNDWQALVDAVEHFSGLPIYLSDSAGWTTTSLRADLARLKAQYKIEWFVLDYLYLLNDGAGMSETEKTGMISSGLKRIVRELDLGAIIIHSMNKEGIRAENPGQADARGSGQVIYDADVAAFLMPYNAKDTGAIPAKDQENIRVLYFAKGRELDGDNQKITLVKKPGFPAFYEYTKGS